MAAQERDIPNTTEVAELQPGVLLARYLLYDIPDAYTSQGSSNKISALIPEDGTIYPPSVADYCSQLQHGGGYVRQRTLIGSDWKSELRNNGFKQIIETITMGGVLYRITMDYRSSNGKVIPDKIHAVEQTKTGENNWNTSRSTTLTYGTFPTQGSITIEALPSISSQIGPLVFDTYTGEIQEDPEDGWSFAPSTSYPRHLRHSSH